MTRLHISEVLNHKLLIQRLQKKLDNAKNLKALLFLRNISLLKNK